jgi:hypothetical protein
MKKPIIVIIAIFVLLPVSVVMVMSLFVHSITPQEHTHTAIGETFVRIYLYGNKYHKIPRSFDVLPVRDGYVNRTTDGWGREIIMKIDNNKITLMSLGKDGVPGGNGENTDVSKSYWLNKPDGALWIDDKDWIVDAEIFEARRAQ